MKNNNLRIQYRQVSKLRPYAKNARVHPPEQIDKIKRLIQTVGFVVPIVVDGKNGILKGHGSLQAAMQLGMDRVPVVEVSGVSDGEKRAFILADNRVAMDAGWDEKLLAIELGDLQRMGLDLALTAFDAKELAFSLEPDAPEPTEPPVPTLPKHAVTRPGDLWLLGEHRLACGDSTKPATLKGLMAGHQAQVVFTDPPYGISYESPSGGFEVIKGDDLRRGQLYSLLHGAFAAGLPHTREDAAWYVWHATGTREDFAKALRDVGLVELGVIIWAKPGMVLGWSDYRWAHEPCFYAARQGVRPAWHGDRTQTTMWRLDARTGAGGPHVAIGAGVILTTPEGGELYVSSTAPKGRKVRHVHVDAGKPIMASPSGGAGDDVWEVSRDNGHGREAYHPTQKPVELARRAMANSTSEGQIVLDPFSGGASTIIAAEQTKRVGYAVDLDARYVDVGVRRWQDLTGKSAIHATEKKTFDAIAKARGKGRGKG
jgi:DNA modification methylase